MSELKTSRAGVLESIAERIVSLDLPHPVRVAVDGLTGAGKTTLADELAPVVERHGRPAIRASIDDFYRPRAERYQLGRLSPEGYYRLAFDYAAIRRVLLEPLGPGGDRRYRAAYFHGWRDAPIESPERLAPADAVVLVDGVFLLRPELNDLWDFRIFVDAAVELAIQRAIARDLTVATSLERVQETYRLRYVPGERIYVDAVHPRERADVIVDTTDPTNPRLTFPQG